MKAVFELYGIKTVLDITEPKPVLSFTAVEKQVLVSDHAKHIIDMKVDPSRIIEFKLEFVINEVAFYKPRNDGIL